MGRHTVVALALAWMSLAASAQIAAQGGAPAPRNLRVLTPDVDIQRVMARFNAALGVQCTHCHVANDFASDANPKKEIARGMLRMLEVIAGRFPDSGNDFRNSRYLPFPDGKQYVTCFTCHQGAVLPISAAPDPKGPARAPEPGSPPAAPGARGTAPPAGNMGRARGGAPAAPLAPGRGAQQHMNMVHLPSDADTFMVMPAFRAALGVECNFCHVFGDKHERGHADERHLDGNPKKLIARNMIGMLKDINATLFPQEDVDIVFAASSIVPEGKRYVTCYTCHRGNHLPLLEPVTASSR
jgi:Photosynthetic reaction centre cytochrome C subunit